MLLSSQSQDLKPIWSRSDCRFRHIKLQSPTGCKRGWCQYCEAYAELIKGKCLCCLHHLENHKAKNLWVKRILNLGRRQLSKEIENWCTWNPDMEKVKTFKDKRKYINKMVLIKRGKIIYELPIKYLVLSQQGINDEKVILDMVKEKLVIKGFDI